MLRNQHTIMLYPILHTASMTFLFTINTFTHFKERFISFKGMDTPINESLRSVSSHLPVVGDSCFAIHLISMDVHAESLVVTNGGGHVMLFDFLKMPPDFTVNKSDSMIQVGTEHCTHYSKSTFKLYATSFTLISHHSRGSYEMLPKNMIYVTAMFAIHCHLVSAWMTILLHKMSFRLWYIHTTC